MSADERPRIDRLLSALEGADPKQSKKAAYVFIGLLVLYTIVRGIAGAAQKPFWFDELFTLTIANQPSLHDLWQAVTRGFDSAPPFFYLVERLALKVTSNKEVALRLPSILAFPCTLICVFVYAKKRNGKLIASLCALLLLSTILFHVYSIEARAYSMVIACIAFALVCYPRLPSPLWAVMFGLSLLLAESIHYYSVFAMIPFGLAEIVMLIRKRAFRWPVWTALVCGVLPLVASWRLLMTIKTNYGPHMFARPVSSALKTYYAAFFLLSETPVGVTLAVVSAAGITSALLWRSGAGDDERVAEGILLLGFVGLPFIVFVPLVLTNGILLNRYVLATTIGMILGIASAVLIAGRKAAAIFALSVYCVVGARELNFWHHPEHDSLTPYFSATSFEELQDMKETLRSAGHPDLPIVVSDCLLHAQFVYYFESNLTNKLVYLADAERELRSTGSDTSSMSQLAFSEFFPLRVDSYSEFTSTHKEFLLYSEGLDWYTPILLDEVSSMQLLTTKYGYGQVYLVRMKEGNAL